MRNCKQMPNQSGRSALEMLGVLVIMAILTIGGIAGYSKAMPRYKMSKLAEQTALIVTNIRAAYSIKDNYAGLTTDAAIQMGAIPRDMVRANVAYNSFNGKILLAPASDSKSVFITMAGLPANACVYLASADWGGRLGSGLVSVATLAQVTQTAVNEQQQDHIGKAEDDTIPLAPAKAAEGCNGIGDTNAVVFQYH